MLFASQGYVAQHIAFGIIAAVMIFSALRVVTTNNVVHAALWLVAVLGGAAALYVVLLAEFVAVTQILVYIGAVMVLFLFGTMLTRARIGHERDLNNRFRPLAVFVALVLAGTLGYVLIDAFGDDKLPADGFISTTQQVSDSIFGTYLLPFWALSFVLLAAVIGAIVLARRDQGQPMLVNEFLLLGAVLFCIGVYGVVARRNGVLVLMSIELILNAVNINLLAFALRNGNVDGQVFALYVIAVAAAEVGVGLAMVLLIYRNRRSIALDELSEMKG